MSAFMNGDGGGHSSAYRQVTFTGSQYSSDFILLPNFQRIISDFILTVLVRTMSRILLYCMSKLQ